MEMNFNFLNMGSCKVQKLLEKVVSKIIKIFLLAAESFKIYIFIFDSIFSLNINLFKILITFLLDVIKYCIICQNCLFLFILFD